MQESAAGLVSIQLTDSFSRTSDPEALTAVGLTPLRPCQLVLQKNPNWLNDGPKILFPPLFNLSAIPWHQGRGGEGKTEEGEREGRAGWELRVY